MTGDLNRCMDTLMYNLRITRTYDTDDSWRVTVHRNVEIRNRFFRWFQYIVPVQENRVVPVTLC